ncbi:PDZ domain-containing protein [Sphingomonas oligoaromativorans]|jgi:S1-C subfamily serine protease|uniref:PDZ domain-containing protein n=1 Tax=Sphingomonas oligoaromativorans TaxID=575322 RepID=UPI0014233FDB|nr:PDZ domain-containing protein [Sphingomonas oligoaromativorans]NIJ31909.1 S1-C subfamily serine protease [Sphingomonas oligoaromativorans]
MMAYRRMTERRIGRGLAIGVGIVVGAVALVLMLAENGSFQRFGRGGGAVTSIPGLTIGDTHDQMPIVTSVRSDGAAERAGIRVGDEIEAIDGHAVHNVAALRAVMLRQGTRRLALHIRRGDAVWTIAIDRNEPAGDAMAATGTRYGAENPAD